MRPSPMAEGQQVISSLRQQVERALYLSERTLGSAPPVIVGEPVRVKAHAQWNSLADEVFTIVDVVGSDENAMVKLRAPDGRIVKWFRATELQRAQVRPKEQEIAMSNNKTTQQKAAAFDERVTALSKSCTLRDAISLATTLDAEGAEAYRLAGIGAEQVVEASAPISLSARTGESFDTLAMRYANEHGVSLRQAVHEVGKARPDLAAARC